MIDKREVISFFDRCAPAWDAGMIRSDRLISKILDNAGVCAGADVLDVACGTGVLFPDYLARGVKSVTGVDISPRMAEIAASKCDGETIRVICCDIEEFRPEHLFDCVVVYNSFPHFPDPSRLIEKLAGLTKEGGRMTVAHGMSRARLDRHHSGAACHVSNGLMEAEKLAALFSPFFDVDTVISDDEMYQVAGVRKTSVQIFK